MNAWLALAAALLVLVGAAHSYLGERYVLTRLFRRGPLPPLFGSDWFTRRTLRFAWHVTTIAWWGAAALCWALGRGDAGLALRLLSATFAATAAVVVVASRGRHLSWPVFTLIAIALWMGATGR